VVYICQMIGFARRPRGRAIGLGVAILSAIFLASLGGCGSDGEGESEKGAASPAKTTPGDNASGESRKAQGAEGRQSPKGAAVPAKDGNAAGHGATPDGGIGARKLAKICPRDLSRAECKSVVRDLAEPSPSHTMDTPRDCLAVMSKEECESMAKAVTGTPTGGSVNVEECVKNPTPHCEEVLGPVLEAMHAARQAGK
jgi:hypothetical protein